MIVVCAVSNVPTYFVNDFLVDTTAISSTNQTALLSTFMVAGAASLAWFVRYHKVGGDEHVQDIKGDL